MVLFTKVYGELSLRIQQSLPRCNNRGAFQAHAGAPEDQEAASPARCGRELVELGKSDTNTFPCRIARPTLTDTLTDSPMLPIMRRQSRAVEYLYRCLVYIDLNMVRARVIRSP